VKPSSRRGPVLRPRPHPTTRFTPRTLAASLGVATILLGACSRPTSYAAATTVVKPDGHCDSSRIVQVGASLDLSGAGSSLGREYLSGLELAVGTVDHARGVLHNHNCVELLYKDDRGNPHIGDKAVLDLVNAESVSFLVGPMSSSQVQFAGDHLRRDGVPTAMFSSLAETYQPRRYPQAFPMATSSVDQATAMASFAKAQHWSKVSVIGVADPAGQQGAAAAATALAKAGLGTFSPVLAAPGRPGAPAAMTQVSDAHPDGVVIMGESLAVADLLEARATQTPNIPVIAEAVAADQAVIARTGMAGLNGVYALVPMGTVVTDPPNTDLLTFRDHLKAALHVQTLDGSIIPYAQAGDAVAMLASVANSVHSSSPGAVRTFLENANYQGLLASYTFTADAHTAIAADQMTVVAVTSLSDGLFTSAAPGAPGPTTQG
jgi:ABC-type branched-subunit amino acid transport system substrate-binding protein